MMASTHDSLTEAQAELFKAANAERPCNLAEIESPDWDDPRRFHWTGYVEETAYRFWSRLPLEAKLVAYVAAAESASNTEFDEERRQEMDLLF